MTGAKLCFGGSRLGIEFFQAFSLGLGQHGDGNADAEQAYERGNRFRAQQTLPGHENGKQEDTHKSAEFAGGGGNAMAGGAAHDREKFGRIDEGGGVWSELGEKVADAIEDKERQDQFIDV